MRLHGLLRLQGVVTLYDLWEGDHWRTVASFHRSTRETRQGDNLGLIWFMEHIQELAGPRVGLKLQKSNGWQWRIGQQKYEGWTHQSHQWKLILNKHQMDYSQSNRRWQVNWTVGQWMSCWKKLWGSPLFHRDKILLWRVINHGLFHNRRALLWGMNDGLCPRCRMHEETINHLFFECRSVCWRWATVAIFMGTRLAPSFMKNSLGDTL